MDSYLSPLRVDRPGRLPSPEDVFFAWMFNLPEGADLRQAARREIARIDGVGSLCQRLTHLKSLFQQATVEMQLAPRRRRRRGLPQ